MKKFVKVFIYACVSAIGIAVVAIFDVGAYFRLSYYLPSEQRVRNDFDAHKADYAQFVELIGKDPSARYVGSHGVVDPDGKTARTVPEYARLIHKIGAQFVIVGDDGSVEFALWGNGCAICSDSYMGILTARKVTRQSKLVCSQRWCLLCPVRNFLKKTGRSQLAFMSLRYRLTGSSTDSNIKSNHLRN